jgi:hypothetical protein
MHFLRMTKPQAHAFDLYDEPHGQANNSRSPYKGY